MIKQLQLKDEERWSEGDSLLGLPKVAHRKSHAGRKAKEDTEKAETTEAVEGAEKPTTEGSES